MNYAEFNINSAAILADRPELIHCAETNLYRSLQSLSPGLPAATDSRLHRCHLASQWTDFYGLPAENSSRALVSCGVRHSLELIFDDCAKHDARVWLPEDNYPVFHSLSEEADLTTQPYCTLPTPVWPGDTPFGGDEFLLLTNPIKPLGRTLAKEDVTTLKQWLGLSERRRLIIDAVYSIAKRLDPGTLELVSTSQVIVLHSLTKAWLHPRLFGIALIPKQDAHRWIPIFRAAPPPQHNLAVARHYLTECSSTPGRVSEALGQAQDAMFSALRSLVPLPPDARCPNYFFPIVLPWEALLARGILGIPASVFGSRRNDITILSSLRFAT